MSDPIFRLMLKLYPRSFMAEFGDESLLLLQDRWRDERGFGAKLRLVVDIALDSGRSFVRERLSQKPSVIGTPLFSEIGVRGPSPAALCGGALTSGFVMLAFAILFLPESGQGNPFSNPHEGLYGLGAAWVHVRHAGQQPMDRFEVASVKPAIPQGMMLVRPLPGRLTANASLQMLIQNAYGVQAFQVAGGPEWARSERYAVEATANPAATRAQILVMLQALLAERFQLKIHRETRDLPAFSLVATGKPVKLVPSKNGSCTEPSPNAPVDWAGGIMAPPGAGPAALPQCGVPRVMLQPAGAKLQGRRVSMGEFARALSLVLERTVIDQTRISGSFDLDLVFLPDETTSAMPPPPPGTAPGLEMKTPTMFTALQEQLGLKLQAAKAAVEIIMIDRAERPSP